MMKDTSILTAIDVGTTKVCTIVGKCSRTRGVEVLGYGIVPCDGLTKGNVRDVPATRDAIRQSAEIAGREAGHQVTSAYVGVTGSHVSYENRVDTLDWVGKIGVITSDDLERVPATIASYSRAAGRKVIHAIPVRYSLDGGYEVRDPLGMHTDRIQVETHLVTGGTYFIAKLMEAVEGAGIAVSDLVLEPLASAEAVLTEREKDQGVALVDIGGGTTDIVVFRNGHVYFTDVIPVGGHQFTNDIAMTYSTPYEAAEEIKLNFANAVPETVRPDDEVIVPVNGRSTGLRVPRHEICQLTRERAQELARLVNIKLRDAGVNRSETTTLVLTGGASNLHGLQPMMQKYFAGKIRQGTPGASLNLPNALRHPAYSTSVGIFLWSVNNYRQEPYKNGSYRTNGHNGANGYNNTNGHNGANGHAVSANGHNGTNGNAAVATYDANGGGLGRLFKSLRKKR